MYRHVNILPRYLHTYIHTQIYRYRKFPSEYLLRQSPWCRITIFRDYICGGVAGTRGLVCLPNPLPLSSIPRDLRTLKCQLCFRWHCGKRLLDKRGSMETAPLKHSLFSKDCFSIDRCGVETPTIQGQGWPTVTPKHLATGLTPSIRNIWKSVYLDF